MRTPTMLAVRTDGVTTRVDEVRRVRPATGEVLVRVTAVALDRRDRELALAPEELRLPPGGRRTLGRHVAGVVAAPGPGVDGWPLGRPVVVAPEMHLRRAGHRLGHEHEGGLAEYVAVPAGALEPLPTQLSAPVAVVLPLAARAHSMLARVGLCAGESMMLWGVGALGASALAVARALGAAPLLVVDPDARAREAALALGADEAFDPEDPHLDDRLLPAAPGGVDVAVHAAPDPHVVDRALGLLSPSGRAVLAGPVGVLDRGTRWDGRCLTGVPPMSGGSLPWAVRMVTAGRLRPPASRVHLEGLHASAEVLGAAAEYIGGVVVVAVEGEVPTAGTAHSPSPAGGIDSPTSSPTTSQEQRRVQ